MPTADERVTDRILGFYQVRREVSQPADLATWLLARLLYDPPPGRFPEIKRVVDALDRHQLKGIEAEAGVRDEFTRWLHEYLVINTTTKGTTFYPIHPTLALLSNGEWSRVEGFVERLASAFTPAESQQLRDAIYADASCPAFERALRDTVGWQLADMPLPTTAPPERFAGLGSAEAPSSPAGLLACTKDDLLALAAATTSVQLFVVHAGRLLAFSLARYLLAHAGIDLSLPIYAAPAADTHEGVKTLAHGIIENHRARFEQKLRERFHSTVAEACAHTARASDPQDEETARELVHQLFGGRANIVPPGEYATLRDDHGSLASIAHHYYWSHTGAGSRFLRQLHGAHLNLAKKAGLANSRSRHTQWHYYWLSRSLLETLILASQRRLGGGRVLVTELLKDWRDRYGIAVLIDASWEEAYRRYFPGLGNPESLNDVNFHRFLEMLEERGRLHKTSDEFPWALLGD